MTSSAPKVPSPTAGGARSRSFATLTALLLFTSFSMPAPARASQAAQAAALTGPPTPSVVQHSVPATASADDPLAGLEGWVREALDAWGVPGLGLAIVKDDEIVLAGGFGVREAGTNERVDEHTVFAIGSAGKAFTAVGVASLVEEGRMEWDDPVLDHLPDFRLFDPWVTREITIRDLLAHRSGLERGEFIWYATDNDRSEILRRVRHLEPSFSFRGRFGYQNIMYLAAGQATAAVSGRSWDEVIRERIFLPLGMARSSTSVTDLVEFRNVARPHVEGGNGPLPIAYREIDNAGPAGSVNGSVRDMAQWLRLHLNGGEYEGVRVLEEATVHQLHAPQTLLPSGWSFSGYTPDFPTYSLGWFVHDYRGRKLVHHGGNIDGMTALLGMLPDEDLGVVILSNMNASGLPQVTLLHVLDRYLGDPREDWSAEALARRDTAATRADERARELEESRKEGTSTRLPLEAYAGRYTDPMHGEAEIGMEDGRLVVRRGEHWVGDLEHWHFDTFRITWRSPGMGAVVGQPFLTFELDRSGEVAGMEIDVVGPFRRAADQEDVTDAGGGG